MLEAPRVLDAWARLAPPEDPPKALPPGEGRTDWLPIEPPPRLADDGVARACAPPAPPRSIVPADGERPPDAPPPRSIVPADGRAWALLPRLPPPYFWAVALSP